MSNWRFAFGRRAIIIQASIGLIVIAAAALKLYGANVSAVSRAGWFAQAWVQLAAAEWEVVLGVWLLSGCWRFGAWCAAIGTFVTFGGISSYLALTGVASCGCFGSIQAGPWYAFAVDVAALISLAIAKPVRVSASIAEGGSNRTAKTAVTFALGTAALAGVLFAAAVLFYGSPEVAIARLSGRSLTVAPGYIDFGNGSREQIIERSIEVRNWTNVPVRLFGGTADCSCVTTVGLPTTIDPGHSAVIPIMVKIPSVEPGLYTRQAEIWTDCPQARTVRIVVAFRVE